MACRTGSTTLRRVYPLYCLSGFISLGYQVSWFRIFVDWFGSTNLTFALVVGNFIGGLSLGALLSERLTRAMSSRTGIVDKLRLYGVVELCAGTTALLTLAAELLPPDLWSGTPYQLKQGLWIQSLHYQAAQVAVAAVCVLVPCLFMGATFPLLCEALRSTARQVPASLYAWNTLGACAGVLASQFILLLWIGHRPSFWLMAGLNLILGTYFLARGGAPQPVPVPARSRNGPQAEVPQAGSLIAAAALGGLVAGALEGDMFKRIGFIILLNPGATMSFISFWAVLGIFLASAFVRHVEGLRLLHIKAAYGLAAIYYLIVWRNSDELTYLLGGRPGFAEAHHFPVNLGQLFVYTGIYVLPSYLLVSLLLPYACNRLQGMGKHLGMVYGLNTVGFCLGMFAFTLIAPKLNIFYSLKLFLLFFAVAAVSLATVSELRAFKPRHAAAFTALVIIACIAAPREFDRSFFTPSMWPYSVPAKGLRSNAAHTTYYVELPGNQKLFFGRLSMSGTSPASQEYMRLMAHFPLLAHPHPRKALLICFGVGNTAAAIASHGSIARIDAVDLNENVFATAPEFAAHHGSVNLDPRLRMIVDDGRGFLSRTGETYDLITSEPPPPMAAGVYRLYSREYYEEVLEHLGVDGLMSQWLPAAQMPVAAVELAARTFVEVFPHSLLFKGADRHMILVGSRAPIDVERIGARFYEEDSVTTDLFGIGVFSPSDLRGRVLRDGETLRRRLGRGRVISDQRNDFEHLLYDPAAVRRASF